MSTEKLKYVSAAVLDELLDKIPENLARYSESSFDDLAVENGWAIDTSTVEVDLGELAQLKKGATTPEAEVTNSLRVYAALKGMTPLGYLGNVADYAEARAIAEEF